MTSLRTPVEVPSVGHPTYSQTFPCEPSTAEIGRDLVRAVLGVWHIDGLADRAALIVTELIANAARHTPCPRSASRSGGRARHECVLGSWTGNRRVCPYSARRVTTTSRGVGCSSSMLSPTAGATTCMARADAPGAKRSGRNSASGAASEYPDHGTLAPSGSRQTPAPPADGHGLRPLRPPAGSEWATAGRDTPPGPAVPALGLRSPPPGRQIDHPDQLKRGRPSMEWPWITGDCWLGCGRTGVLVIWLGPVQ